jgi:starch synthase
MRVLHVCSELFPLLKTGGLADVTGALPESLDKFGVDSRTLVPGFPAFMDKAAKKQLLIELPGKFGASSIRIYRAQVPDSSIELYIIDAPELFNRDGNPYANNNSHAYADNYRRFALLGYIGMQLASGLDKNWTPQVVHAHDWHAGLTAAYMKAHEINTGKPMAGTVYTIHNLAYQGLFPPYTFEELELPNQFFEMNGMEFYGKLSFMKAGLFFSNKITTVSPTYALEIQGEEQGCGLNGLLGGRRYDLRGILNGVDPKVWSPSKDKLIHANYSVSSMAGKLKCKTALQEQMGLKVQDEKPLFVVVSRLTEQKGLNLVLEGLPELLKQGGQIAVLGSGDKDKEEAFRAAAATNPDMVAVQFGYDEAQAHRIIAGGDVILVPSRYEPCGLTQLYGLGYGTLPLVRAVGGLVDTVTDCALENMADKTATGFVFEQFNVDSYNRAVRRAFALYERKTDWKQVQKRGMQQGFGWDVAAKQYLSLYEQVAR